jgi:hypothetical protein
MVDEKDEKEGAQTDDVQELPFVDPRGASGAALLVSFPTEVVLPLPPSGLVVGRSWFEEHGVRDSTISREHVRFLYKNHGQPAVVDARGRSGTFVDGERLEPGGSVLLVDGAVVRVASTVMVYRDYLLGPRETLPAFDGIAAPFGLREARGMLEAIPDMRVKNVLIQGETGTGKDLMARAVARAAGRGSKSFQTVNVANLQPGTMDSELWGHTRGAFSDAREASRGVFTEHDGGTVFLDEIAELPIALQSKLLVFIQNREVKPVGAARSHKVDVLVVCATNRMLRAAVFERDFRQDLAARFTDATINMPPLRDRPEDIFTITRSVAATLGRSLILANVEARAVEWMMLQEWPDNVRGIEGMLQRIRPFAQDGGLRYAVLDAVLGISKGGKKAEMTEQRVRDVLDRCEGNKSVAAGMLGVSRGKLLRFMQEKGMA